MNDTLEILINDLKRTNYYIKQLNEVYKNLDENIYEKGKINISIDKSFDGFQLPNHKKDKFSTTLTMNVDLFEQYIIVEIENQKYKYDEILNKINKYQQKETTPF